jgi:hypothetical protein
MRSMTKTVLRYVVGGLFIGGFWYINRSRSPVEEALRTLCVFAALLLFARARLKREAIEVHLVPLFLSKAVLVGGAAIVETMLEPRLNDPALIVAIGLGVVVAVLGPVGDRHFFTRMTATPIGGGSVR